MITVLSVVDISVVVISYKVHCAIQDIHKTKFPEIEHSFIRGWHYCYSNQNVA